MAKGLFIVHYISVEMKREAKEGVDFQTLSFIPHVSEVLQIILTY